MAGRSGRGFADDIDVPFTTVNSYLKGRKPSVDFVTKVCDATGASADWLLRGKGEPFSAGDVPDPALAQLVDQLASVWVGADDRVKARIRGYVDGLKDST